LHLINYVTAQSLRHTTRHDGPTKTTELSRHLSQRILTKTKIIFVVFIQHTSSFDSFTSVQKRIGDPERSLETSPKCLSSPLW